MLFALACAEPDPAELPDPLELTVSADDATGTVLTITWSTPDAGDTWIDFGEDATYGRSIAGSGETTHTLVLAGLAAGYTWHWRARSETTTGTRVSDDQVFEVPPPPVSLGRILPEVFAPDLGNGGYTLTTLGGVAAGVVLLDAEGRVVWWYETPADTDVIEARMSADGRSVLYTQVVPREEDQAELVRQPLTGEEATRLVVPFQHHDFLEVEGGGAVYLQHDVREVDGAMIGADALSAVDADGTVRTIWSAFDTLTPGADIDVNDWTHCNGLAVDPDTGGWLIGCRNLDSVLSIAPDGTLSWQLGGEDSDFALTSGTAFVEQHGPTLVPGGILVYDNGDSTDPTSVSRAAEYAVDRDARTWREVWSYTDGETYTWLRGSAERLPNGNTLVGTGSGGRISEVTPDGTVVWQVEMELGSDFSYAHHVPTLGGAP